MEELDKLLMVQLRDGRKIMGILRCLVVTGKHCIAHQLQRRPVSTVHADCAEKVGKRQHLCFSVYSNLSRREAAAAAHQCTTAHPQTLHRCFTCLASRAPHSRALGGGRSFDQFANLVLEGAVERVIVGALYSEMPLGLYVVRGENVVLLGEIDETRDPPPALQRARRPRVCWFSRVC